MSDWSGLLINNNTLKQAELFFNNPGHALLILGPYGYGKKNLSLIIAAQMLGLQSKNKLNSYPYFFHIKKDGKTEISIDQIRDLISRLKLKVPGNKKIKKVVFIENAELMSIEAQNALLKALEEPSFDTLFLLTSVSENKMLPTITSRTRKIAINTVGINKTMGFYEKDYSHSEIKSAWMLSGGAPGLISSLLSKNENHELKGGVLLAKKILTMNRYQLFLTLQEVSDKEQLYWLLEGLKKVLTVLYKSGISKNQTSGKLLSSRRLVNELISNLESNTSPRLIKLRLVMNLSI